MKHEVVSYRVRDADWDADGEALRAVRHLVFVVEQRVPEELEWDGIDSECRHVIAEDLDGNAIATGRLLPDGHIGRMAVLHRWRRRGVGSAVLIRLVELGAERGFTALVLNAQLAAVDFYQRHGFVAFGDPFDEAGIPHRRMNRDSSALDRPSGQNGDSERAEYQRRKPAN